MYPFLRLIRTMVRARRLPEMHPLDPHVSQHRCWPVDCDMFMEMNNGRILTLYELPRFELAVRTGLWKLLRKNKWAFAVAGTSVRYRKRLTPFEPYEARARLLGWDERFFYFEQGMFKRDGTCASHVLFRTAVVAKGKALPSETVAEALGLDATSPALPDWAQNWMDADKTRVWPPEL